MRTLSLAILSLLLFTLNSFAAEVDITKSTFKWKATKKIGESHSGPILLKSAKVEKDGDELKSAEFVMDMNSIGNEDIESPKYKKKFIDHVKNEDFFEVKKFPTSVLKLTKFSKSMAEGTLKIKDKTHPTKVSFELKDGFYTGTLKFDRTKFGVVYNSENFFKNLAAKKIINNEVTVDFNVALKQ